MTAVGSSFGHQRGVVLPKATSVSGAALSYYFAAGSSTCETMGSLFSVYPLYLYNEHDALWRPGSVLWEASDGVRACSCHLQLPCLSALPICPA